MLKSILLQDNSPPIGKFTNHNKLNTSIMKQTFLFLILATSFLTAKSQLNKGNWLVGGTGKFYSYNDYTSSSTYNVEGKYTEIAISPSVGYFVIDKLAFGLKPTFSSLKGKVTSPGGGITNIQRYWIGPFGRYYFLEKEKPYNIVTDISYQFGLFNSGGQKGKLTNFSALVGPVIYFNTSVGIEFLLGYSYTKEDIEAVNKIITKGFQIAVGFQIHLEK